MNPLYKVILVEDEIVTREGIRDNVNWNAHGFQFCGDASDGEMALSQVEATRPDVIITDIKMPFMDGLQLCKIVRERFPWIKIVILSGHDEFQYAHQAIQLGVKEYLLKPVTVENLGDVLDRMGKLLDQERVEKEKMHHLQAQVEENRTVLRERFLLKLVVGAISSSEAMEKSQQLGLDLVARYYLVVLIKAELADRSEQFDYDEYVQVQHIVSDLVGNNPDIFLLKKDWEEFVLLFKGNTPEFVEEEKDLILDRIRSAVGKTRYSLTVGSGTPKSRMTHIYQSFIEAIETVQNASGLVENDHPNEIDRTKLLKVDKAAVEDYLRCGAKEDVNTFFDTFIEPLGEAALQSSLIKNYIFVDVVLATAKFISELGGEIDQAVAEFDSIEKILLSIKTINQLREQVSRILISALLFRDRQTNKQYSGMIKQAKIFINEHYMDADMGLNEVAARVNLSPSHFSVVFSQENCQTFKEYLTEIRIRKAKELLRTTSLGATEISLQIGYSDPHYFSYVFKKNTGMSPTEFRLQTQAE
jgi:two-component system, response regulator YesN